MEGIGVSVVVTGVSFEGAQDTMSSKARIAIVKVKVNLLLIFIPLFT